MISAFFSGLFVAISLIFAIGAQNAFILRQGLLREHVFILCLICSISDSILIAAGVAGLGALVEQYPTFLKAILWGGAIFLLCYALFALRRAFAPEAMTLSNQKATSLKQAIGICLAFTFLNPHVYLDTVLLLGSISTKYSGNAKLVFAVGAMLGSFVWFFSLGYGARILQPIFAKPRAWRILDGLIALVMTLIAISLIRSAL